jgi:hypothetical protein
VSTEAATCAACGRSEDIAVDDCDVHLARLGAMIESGRANEGAHVVDLNAERERRERESASAAHDRGEAFAFDLRDDLGADDAPIGHSAGVVTILLNADALTGIALSPDAARRLGVALIECAALCEHGVGEVDPGEAVVP